MRKMSEPARLPCCDFPPDWAPKKGGPPMVDVRKCLWVADKVLMRRHTKTAYTFAAALAVKVRMSSACTCTCNGCCVACDMRAVKRTCSILKAVLHSQGAPELLPSCFHGAPASHSDPGHLQGHSSSIIPSTLMHTLVMRMHT